MWPFTRTSKATPGLRDDAFWLSDDARMNGLITAAQRSLASGAHIVIVAHSTPTLDRLAAAAAHANLAHEFLHSPTTAPQLLAQLQSHSAPPILLALASSLLPSPPRSAVAPLKPTLVSVLIAERFPLRAADDAIASFATALPAHDIEFHVCIKDPLMQGFAGDRTENILRTLGMTDTESVVHPMLSRSIERAQEKVAQQCPDPSRVEAWLADRHRT